MLVDDHTMVRRGLATFLKVFNDLQRVGEAESGKAAIQLCVEVMPDVILMDMVLPLMDGATATRIIRQQFPQVKAIVLTSFKEGELIKDALEAEAIGYLLKDVSADDLPEPSALRIRGAQPSLRRLPKLWLRPPINRQRRDLT